MRYGNTDLRDKVRFFIYIQFSFFIAIAILGLYDVLIQQNLSGTYAEFIALAIIAFTISLALNGYLTIALFIVIFTYYAQLATIPIFSGPIYYGTIFSMTGIHFMVAHIANSKLLKWFNTIMFILSIGILFYCNSLDFSLTYHSPTERVLLEVILGIVGLVSILSVHLAHNFAKEKYEQSISTADFVMQRVAKANSSLIFIQNLSGKIISVNEAFAQFVGLSVEACKGKKLEELMTTSSTSFQADDKQVMQNLEEVRVENILIEKAGKEYWLDFTKTPFFDGKQELIGVLGVGIDVSEKMRNSLLLNRQAAILNGVFDSTLDGILAFDKTKRLVAFNKISEYTFRLLLDKELQPNALIEDYVPKEYIDDHNALIADAQLGKTTAVESKISHKKKDYYFKFVHAPARDKRGNIFGSMLVIKNVTRRKEQQMQMKNLLYKAQESDRLKSAFIANISHEIRTPMNGILGFSELMLSPDTEEYEKHEYANIINDNCQHLMQIVDDLLDIAKIETGTVKVQKEHFQLLPFMRQLYVLFYPVAQEKGIELLLHPDVIASDLLVFSDKKKVRQVLTNLLSNAIKFTKQGKVELSCHLQKDSLIFTIKDTGVGIPDDKKEFVFERFQQAEIGYARTYDGTGLGLSISKGLTSLLEGDIYFESEEHKGTTFYFSLPYEVMPNKAPTPKTEVNGKHISLKGKTILLADDLDFNAKLIQKIVEPLEARIIRAKTGQEAIRLAEQHTEVDLILMDVQIPQMNGIDVANYLKAQAVDTPIVALTAISQEEDIHALLQAKFDGYLSKPFKRASLMDCLIRHLH